MSAYDDLLGNAGATRPKRDAVDLRVVAEVSNGTGTDVSDPAEVGGWPWMSSATPPVDTDHDGMPDSWEVLNGLDPDDGSDGARDLDDDGYTNVEEFLNATDPKRPDLSYVPEAPGALASLIATAVVWTLRRRSDRSVQRGRSRRS